MLTIINTALVQNSLTIIIMKYRNRSISEPFMINCSNLSLAAKMEPATASFFSPVSRSLTRGRICWKQEDRALMGFQFWEKDKYDIIYSMLEISVGDSPCNLDVP